MVFLIEFNIPLSPEVCRRTLVKSSGCVQDPAIEAAIPVESAPLRVSPLPDSNHLLPNPVSSQDHRVEIRWAHHIMPRSQISHKIANSLTSKPEWISLLPHYRFRNNLTTRLWSRHLTLINRWHPDWRWYMYICKVGMSKNKNTTLPDRLLLFPTGGDSRE